MKHPKIARSALLGTLAMEAVAGCLHRQDENRIGIDRFGISNFRNGKDSAFAETETNDFGEPTPGILLTGRITSSRRDDTIDRIAALVD